MHADSISNQDFFSVEGFLDFLGQLSQPPRPLSSPKFTLLKRTKDYQVS